MPVSFSIEFLARSKTYEEKNNVSRFLNRSASLTQFFSALDEDLASLPLNMYT